METLVHFVQHSDPSLPTFAAILIGILYLLIELIEHFRSHGSSIKIHKKIDEVLAEYQADPKAQEALKKIKAATKPNQRTHTPPWIKFARRLLQVALVAIVIVSLSAIAGHAQSTETDLKNLTQSMGTPRVEQRSVHTALDDVERHIESVDSKLAATVNQVDAKHVVFHSRTSDVYHALKNAVLMAKEEVRTMHLRSIPPPVSSASLDYQQSVQDMARTHPDVKFFRLINIAAEDLLPTAKKMLEFSKEATNYQIGGLEWKYHVPFLNLVIVDEKVGFICIYSLGHETIAEKSMQAIEITDPDIVRSLSEYHLLLWNESIKGGELSSRIAPPDTVSQTDER